MTSPIDLVVNRLKSQGCNPRENGAGQFKSKCPCHKGKSSNLSVKAGDDGTVILHCHHEENGGKTCSADAIARALGLELKDLFPPKPGSPPKKPRPARDGPRRDRNGKAWGSPDEAIGWLASQAGGRVSKLGPWVYNDPERFELMRVYRIDLPDGTKQFRPVHPDHAGWHIGDPSLRLLPLYHLDELAAADTVFVCEGEKCGDLVRGLGVIATTSSHGSNSPQKTDWAPLAGKSVVILPDHDKAGEGYAEAVAGILTTLDPRPRIKVVRLPLKAEGDDAEQWLESLSDGWGPDDCRRELERLAAAAPEWKPGATAAAVKDGDGIDYAAFTDEELGLIGMSGVKEAIVDWLWQYRLARGEMALMAGEGGLGKSQVLLAIAAAISNGSEWPDGSGKAPLGHVVILSAEDSPETTIKPRLMALGANLDNITLSKAKVVTIRDGKRTVSHISLQDRGYWRAVFDRRPNTVLFIVDPIPSYLGRGVNDQRNNEIREVLEPFIEDVIRPRGICMFANTHLNKSIDIKTPIHRVTGSIAYGNIPRNVHFVVRDPDRPERRYLKQCKCNNAPDELPALAFRVEKRVIPSAAGDIETAIPAFEEGTVNVDLPSLLSGEKRKGPKPIKTDKLAVWLFDYLSGHRGPSQAGPLHDAAGAAFASEVPNPMGEKQEDGLWSNGRNLKRAADRIPFLEPPRNGKKVVKFRDTEANRWYWQLIDAEAAF